MQDHNDGHDQRNNVHEARCALENKGIGELNVPRVAFCLDPNPKFDIGDASDDRA
jgi:hypothetical protein